LKQHVPSIKIDGTVIVFGLWKGDEDMEMKKSTVLLICTVIILIAAPLWAMEDEAELAKKLSNPVASLISIPLQNNWDFGIGPEDATRYTLNIQPVIPFSINRDWNMITRTIVPVIHAEEPVKGTGDKSGLGDILQSFFFSPKAPTSAGWIWGAGPVFLYPSGTDNLSADKWGAGPTAVVLKQESGWTYGLLVNHLWTFAERDERKPDVNATFLQPFLSFTAKTFTTFGLNAENTYDWENEQWTVPVNVSVSQLLKIGAMPISVGAGYKYYADKPDGGPDWGLRFSVTFLLPK